MGKLLVGFLAGVAVSVAAVVLLDGPTATTTIQTADRPLLSSVRAFDEAAIQESAAGRSVTLPEQRSENPAVTDAQASQLDDFEARRQEAFRRRDEAQKLLNERTAELGVLQAEKWRRENPIVSPLALPVEFEWLANSTELTSYDRIQRESRDPDWSAKTEANIVGYLTRHPEITDAFGYPALLECRATQCGLTFRLSSNEPSYKSTQLLNTLFSDYFETASDSLPDRGSSEVDTKGGVTTIFWTMMSTERATESVRERCNQPQESEVMRAVCSQQYAD